jgi:hypothetical protein
MTLVKMEVKSLSDKKYKEIKETLENRYKNTKVEYRPRELLDEIIVHVSRIDLKFCKNYINKQYGDIMKLRVEMDNDLHYTYMNTTKEKYDKIKKQRLRHQERFKWIYAQIKDEDVYLKNAKIPKEVK